MIKTPTISAFNAIKKIKNKERPKYFIDVSVYADIRKRSDFTLNDVPHKVAKYFEFCGYKCILIDSEIPFWFAAHNALVLAKKNAIDEFSDFCLDIDKDSLFACNQKIKKASVELDALLDDYTVSDMDYMWKLRAIRKSVKNALGSEAYKNYVDIINRSGNDSLRFVNELLQNADDCSYADGVVPEFSLKYGQLHMETYCNETGFDRANVRAITAIGDSTAER